MSLLFSIFLMPLSSILVKYNRMSSVPGKNFFPFAATALTEALKGVMCLSIYFFTRNMNPAPAPDTPKTTELETEVAVAEPKSAYEHFQDSLYYALPSFLYMVDNNLMFVVLRYISPATLHLFSNMKIIFVAVLFRFALNRAINRIQWVILFCLVGGLIIAQSDQGVSASASRIVSTNATAVEQIAPSAATVGSITQSLAASHQWRAFALVCLMCLCSAVASILLEYAYKTRKQEMLLQQFQLYVYGVIMNAVSLFIHNAVDISKDGVFRGFNPLVWAIICASACTGIAVSYVLKYSDNIGNIFAHAAGMCFIV
jgi:UDP-sugar transporter A1/2/3